MQLQNRFSLILVLNLGTCLPDSRFELRHFIIFRLKDSSKEYFYLLLISMLSSPCERSKNIKIRLITYSQRNKNKLSIYTYIYFFFY